MIPIDFKGRNVIFAEDQPQYLPLPALALPDPEGEVITCWSFSDEEWEVISKNRYIFLSQLRFSHYNEKGDLVHNPLQPIRPMAELGNNIAFI